MKYKEVIWAYSASESLKELMAKGWEPFAVTGVGSGVNASDYKVWLRR